MTVFDTIKVANTNCVPNSQYQRHIQGFSKPLWQCFLDSVNYAKKILKKILSQMFGKAVITDIATGGFCKKGVLRKSAQSTGNHLCQSLFFIKLQASACNFPKKETLTLVFSCKFCKISKKIFFTEHLRPTASERFIRRHNYKILHVYFILPKLLQYL